MKDCHLVGHVLRTNSVFQYIPHTYSANFDKWVHGTYGVYIFIYSYSGSLRCINYTVRGQQIKYHTVLIIHIIIRYIIIIHNIYHMNMNIVSKHTTRHI